MNLPSQSVALLQAARDLVKSLPADAVLLVTETAVDWDEVTRMLAGCKLFIAAETITLALNYATFRLLATRVHFVAPELLSFAGTFLVFVTFAYPVRRLVIFKVPPVDGTASRT